MTYQRLRQICNNDCEQHYLRSYTNHPHNSLSQTKFPASRQQSLVIDVMTKCVRSAINLHHTHRALTGRIL